jgi:trans-aconitate methyltransferase
MKESKQGFWHDEKNVDQYIEMAEGYDGRELVDRLRRHVDDGASVLELGMGPGKDLDLLREHYAAVGSDVSRIFLDRYKQQHPDAEVIELDAALFDTDRHFDAVYSNKVLQHLTRAELEQSLERQADQLLPGGVLLHSFWVGDDEDHEMGVLSTNWTEDTLKARTPSRLEVVETERYREFEDGDSLVVVWRRVP